MLPYIRRHPQAYTDVKTKRFSTFIEYDEDTTKLPISSSNESIYKKEENFLLEDLDLNQYTEDSADERWTFDTKLPDNIAMTQLRISKGQHNENVIINNNDNNNKILSMKNCCGDCVESVTAMLLSLGFLSPCCVIFCFCI